MKFGPFTWITRIILVAALALSAQVATQGQTTNFRSYKLIDIGGFGGHVSTHFDVPADQELGPSSGKWYTVSARSDCRGAVSVR